MKLFDSWNTIKKEIEHSGQPSLKFSEGDVWWSSVGVNIGSEQDGKHAYFERPVLVVKKFGHSICWVIPLSSKNKDGYMSHVVTVQGVVRTALLVQLRVTSVKRFRRKIGYVAKGDLRNL